MRSSASPNPVRAAVLLGLLLGCCAGCRPALESTRGSFWAGTPRDSFEVSTGAQGNWPGFRGVNGSGVSHETGLPVYWSSAENIVWRVSLPGWGRSSPIVWGDSVVLAMATGGGSTAELAVLCLERENGNLRWQADLGPARDGRHTINGLAAATPVTNGEAIYAYFGSNGLFCLDFEGQVKWHASLGEVRHDWGSCSSPILVGDLVIQLCDHKNASFLAAFDARTGEPVWKTERKSYGCWSTPVLLTTGPEAGSRAELIVNGSGSDEAGGGWVTAYDPHSGRELWRVQGTTDSVWPSPIVGAGLVYSTSGRNGPLLAIRPGGRGDVTATHVEWKKRRGAPYVPTGIAYRNRLYLLTDGGVLSCLDAAEGIEVWRQRLDGMFTAGLVAGDGKIYAVSERGRVMVVAAADEFELLATNEMNERILATPAISRGHLFLRSESHLTCISAAATDPPAVPSSKTDAAFDEEDIVSPSDLAAPPETPADEVQESGAAESDDGAAVESAEEAARE